MRPAVKTTRRINLTPKKLAYLADEPSGSHHILNALLTVSFQKHAATQPHKESLSAIFVMIRYNYLINPTPEARISRNNPIQVNFIFPPGTS